MNRAERRAKARGMAKGHEDRRTLARAMKTMVIADADTLERADPYPSLRAAGVTIATPKEMPATRGGVRLR